MLAGRAAVGSGARAGCAGARTGAAAGGARGSGFQMRRPDEVEACGVGRGACTTLPGQLRVLKPASRALGVAGSDIGPADTAAANAVWADATSDRANSTAMAARKMIRRMGGPSTSCRPKPPRLILG